MSTAATKRSSSLISWIVGAVLFLLLTTSPLRWDNIQFILLALVPCFFLIEYSARNRVGKILVSLPDFLFFGFLFLGGLSSIWAIDSSAVWLNLCVWMTLVFFMVVSRQELRLVSQRLDLMLLLGLIFNITILYHVVVVLCFIGRDGQIWNQYFGYNGNVSASVIICLIPFILYNNRFAVRWKVYYKILVLLISFFICIALGSRSNLLLLGVISIGYYSFSRGLSSRLVTIIHGFLLVLIIAILLIYNKENLIDVGSLNLRYQMFLCSRNLIELNTWLGIGLGNWNLAAFQFPEINNAHFINQTNPIDLIRSTDHNMFSRIAAEIGVLGLILLLIPICLILKSNKGVFKGDSDIDKAAFVTILVCLFSSSVYLTSSPMAYFFSKPMVLLFLSLGILSRDLTPVKGMSYFVRPIFYIPLSVLLVVYFVYVKINYDRTKWAVKNEDSLDFDSISVYKDLYIPGVYNATFDRESIEFKLGKILVQKGAFKEGRAYLLKALDHDPYNIRTLNYLSAMLLMNRDHMNSLIYANKSYQLQNQFIQTVLILYKNHADLDELDECYYYLSQLDLPKRLLVLKELLSVNWLIMECDSIIRDKTSLRWQNIIVSGNEVEEMLTANKQLIEEIESEILLNFDSNIDELTTRIFKHKRQCEDLLLLSLPHVKQQMYLESGLKRNTDARILNYANSVGLSDKKRDQVQALYLQYRIERRLNQIAMNKMENLEDRTQLNLLRTKNRTLRSSYTDKFRELLSKDQMMKLEW